MLEHRHGGTIKAITHVGHQTYKGVADWFFVGDVKWQDGTESKGLEIAPHALCGEPQEVGPYLGKLNAYLERAGEWHDPKHKRDGRVVSWTPKKTTGREALA